MDSPQQSGDRPDHLLPLTILEQMSDALFALDADWRFTYANPRAEALLQRPRHELVGRSIWDEFPAAVGSLFEQQYRQAMSTRSPVTFEVQFAAPDAWFEVRAYPSSDGLAVFLQDINDRKQAEAAQAERTRLAAMEADIGQVLTRLNDLAAMLDGCATAIVRHLDAAFARIWTLNPQQQVLELQASAGLYTHLDGPHSRVPVGELKIGRIAGRRQPHLTNAVLGDVEVADQEWARREGMVSFAGYPLLVEDRLVGVIAMFARMPLPAATLQTLAVVATNVAAGIERKRAEERLREESRVSETLYTIGSTLAAELDTELVVQTVTDAATSLIGAQFGAFFYNVVNESGEAYTLYTISGVPREAFAGFPMPRNTAIFNPTFRGESVIRSDDIHQDPRYGKNAPYFGMPPGHLPVRSYLAMPVIARSGEVLGGLFFGHPQPGRFREHDERLVIGMAAQAAVALDNARLYQQAQQAIAIRDQFLAIASHELRTPLTTLKGQLELSQRRLRRDVPRETVIAALEQANVQADRLNRLVGELLDVSRLAGGRFTISPESTPIEPLVERIVATERSLEPARRIDLTSTTADISLPVDPGRLEQALINLLQNARKFSSPDTAITVQIVGTAHSVTITVRDRGIGIPPEDLSRIFTPFHRARNVQPGVSGLGLGLYISRQIVRAHGGTLDADSEPGAGSTFTITLPRSDASTATIQ